MIIPLFVTAAAILSPVIALAGAASGSHAGGIPIDVLYQAINFTLYIGLLIYFLRGPVRTHFQNREQAYKQALTKAEAAKLAAEARQKEIQDRLTHLQETSARVIETAKAEAEAMKAKIIADAEDLARSMREEAKRAANLEIQRAKSELREELLSQAVALSTKLLQDKMVDSDQKRLQTEFVDKIQVVGQ